MRKVILVEEMFPYEIDKNPETGFTEIRPMNEENVIVIHGVKEAMFFIRSILRSIGASIEGKLTYYE